MSYHHLTPNLSDPFGPAAPPLTRRLGRRLVHTRPFRRSEPICPWRAQLHQRSQQSDIVRYYLPDLSIKRSLTRASQGECVPPDFQIVLHPPIHYPPSTWYAGPRLPPPRSARREREREGRDGGGQGR